MQTIHKMKLQPEPFETIKSGKKIIESRLFDEKRKLIKIGDIVEFSKNPKLEEALKVKVIALFNYPSFKNLFSDFSAEWFGRQTKVELLEEIEKFYSKEKQKEFGVLGIKIELV